MRPIHMMMLANNNRRKNSDYDRPYNPPEDRYRDSRGREHYENGRYAPMRSAMDDRYIGDYPRRYSMPHYPEYPEPHRIGFDVSRKYYQDDIPQSHYDDKGQFGHDDLEDAQDYHLAAKFRMYKGGGSYNGLSPMDERVAKEWTKHMINADGTKGPHWSPEEVKQVINQRGLNVDFWPFYAALNAEYSDRCKVNKKYNVNNIDFYVDCTMYFWMEDEDAVDNKTMAYYTFVVDHK